jgi:hypothetical protein
MDYKVNKKKKKSVHFTQKSDDSIKLEKKGMVDLAKLISSKVSFKISDYFMILIQFIPSMCRTERMKR